MRREQFEKEREEADAMRCKSINEAALNAFEATENTRIK